ncbi:BOI-related gene 1 [Hibiscus trionum]|uniref:BOI-related gene 1 n=1 Tax=Hibiscus trionum TaxID=183268 RepID=A0A9W7M4Z9_HIBTR|nr:BOI-related gene 1 [Hibiscus trionum]
MAVKARHMNIFPPQLITNRDFCVPLVDPNISAKTSINKTDSGLTYNMNVPVSAPRKRSRDYFNNGFHFDSCSVPQKNKLSGVSSVILDNHVFSQIQQQEQEEEDIDRFVYDHTEKLRLGVEERRKRESRMLITAIQEGVMKKLKEKDEEIQRIGKLNWVLQERVKSLYVENQLWRDLAQTNEAAANSLRINLEQVLANVGEERRVSGGGAAALEDDAESSCGSSDEGWRKVVGVAEDKAAAVVGRKCRKCGEKESSVLLLPCRHVCLCTMCGSTMVVSTCPVCLSVANASVHVNIS